MITFDLRKVLVKLPLAELKEALADLTLDDLKEAHNLIREERDRTLDQLPAMEYSRFCKLPPNRKDINCSNQRARELVKIMEHLTEAELVVLKAIWNYPVSY